jgi:polysaccharide pyruvyl transferase WcaK-like protein
MRIATLDGPLEIGVEYWRTLPASKFDQAAPQFYNPRNPHNVGDWFLTKIVDRLLDFDELVLLHRGAEQRAWDEVNETCDALVLRGGNYIQRDFLSTHVGTDALLRITIPIILFGAGIQEVPAGGVAFTDDEQRVLHHIHDSCEFSAVRGDLSAEALASIGITNTVVTGCPTLFWSRQPRLELRNPTADSMTAAFSFRQSLYSSDLDVYRAQFAAIDSVRKRFPNTTVILQGEEVALQQLHMARRWGSEFKVKIDYGPGKTMHLRRERMNPEQLIVDAHAQYDRFADPALVDWLTENTFFSWDIGEYLDLYRRQDVLVGCRFHSNLLAMANGTPSYYLTYDQRTREFVELMNIPSSTLESFSGEVDVVDQPWHRVEDAYEVRFAEMRRFLDGNVLSHRLTVPTRPQPALT